MLRTFNMGVGLILILAASDADGVVTALRATGETATRIGTIGSATAGQPPRVRYASAA